MKTPNMPLHKVKLSKTHSGRKINKCNKIEKEQHFFKTKSFNDFMLSQVQAWRAQVCCVERKFKTNIGDSDSKYRCVTKSKERLELNKVADLQHKYKMSTSYVQVQNNVLAISIARSFKKNKYFFVDMKKLPA